MGPLMKIVTASALALGAVDGHAKANHNCIRMLEVRPVPHEVALARPCPMAIRFDARRRVPTSTPSARVSPPIPLAAASIPHTRSTHPTDRARPV